MLGWITDVFRAGIALWYWNLRKTWFRLRGARGRAPCQNPSDSGRAGVTGCEACMHWHEPTRFRRVCPLLGLDTQGRRVCTVDGADVRPFWVRAIAWQGGGVLAIYLLVTLLVFGVMRRVGYPVNWFDIAWPPAWSQLNEARAEFFYAQGQDAYQEGRISATVASLVLARQYDPTHFGTGMLLAQIWQTARPDSADQIYRTLLDAHPDRAVPVAEAWFRSLLTRGNLPAVADLAAHALRFDPANTPVWLNALLFATALTDNDVQLRTLARNPATLDPTAARVITLELAVRDAPTHGQRRTLLAAPPTATAALGPFEVVFRVRRLIALNEPETARTLLDAHADILSERDRVSLQLDTYAALGYARPRTALLARLRQLPPSPVIVDIVAAHLIRHPEPDLYRAAIDDLLRRFDSPEAANYAVYLTLYCLAGTYNDTATLDRTVALIKASTQSEFRTLDAVHRFFLQGARGPIGSVLPILQPLSLEITYAMLTWEKHRPPPPPPPRR